MNRRAFLRVAIIAAAFRPHTVWAQAKGRLPRIGFLSFQLKSDSRLDSFIAGMREVGYVDGKTISIEWRFAAGDTEALGLYAAELVRMKPDLIVAVHPQAVEAVRRLTATIPIVFTVGQDPVAMGFAKTLARPGGNITGLSSMAADMGIKHIEVLQAALPRCARVAVLLNPTNEKGAPVLRTAYESAGRKLGVEMQFLAARSAGEIDRALAAAKKDRADAVVIAPDGFFLQVRERIVSVAIEQRLPTLFLQRESAAAGGFISYGPDGREQYRRTGSYVRRILDGANPGDLPIEQPTKLEMVVNLRTAAALGIKVGAAVIARADEVIR
jgi:putative ABC transport system substrate-binding protein